MVDSAEFHCWYCRDRESAREKGRYLLQKFGGFIKGPVVDLGCGEGAFLLALIDIGQKDVLGIELNEELASMAESFGVPVVRKDILQYFRESSAKVGTYLYIDVVEHVSFEFNLELLRQLPPGSRLILQTPNTESLLGHQFYFNVPSHVAPYSPFTIRKMLSQSGYQIVREGSVDGTHPNTWIVKLRKILIRRLLGVPQEMFTGGGNYFVIADRLHGEDKRGVVQ